MPWFSQDVPWASLGPLRDSYNSPPKNLNCRWLRGSFLGGGGGIFDRFGGRFGRNVGVFIEVEGKFREILGKEDNYLKQRTNLAKPSKC